MRKRDWVLVWVWIVVLLAVIYFLWRYFGPILLLEDRYEGDTDPFLEERE